MEITNKHKLPVEIVNAVKEDEYDFVPKPKKFSVSNLVSPPRQVILYRRHSEQISRDVSCFLPRVLGQAIHKIIEKGAVANGLAEERLECPIAGGVLSGKMDIYRDEKVIDVKTTSVWTLYHNPQGRNEWVLQTNAYAWLLRQHGFPVKEIHIFAILLGWNVREAKTKNGYPQSPMAMLEIPVMSDKAIEEEISKRMEALIACEDLPDECLPVCDERWNNDIRCKEYCDVCEFCDYYNSKYASR